MPALGVDQLGVSLTAGQPFTMELTAGPNPSSGYSVSVYQPSSVGIAYAQPSSNSHLKVDLAALPATGTYSVTVVPNGVTTGYVDLRLVPGATGTLVIGDPAKAVSLGVAQNGRYSFSGTSGDLLTLSLPSLATNPAGTALALYLYRPDGTSMWSGYATASGGWSIPQLPSTGIYSLAVRPVGAAAANFDLQLVRR
jgi:hypothetical protein